MKEKTIRVPAFRRATTHSNDLEQTCLHKRLNQR